MNPHAQALTSHLANDATTVCFAWVVRRSDGLSLGFTDHDRSLILDGITCEPQTGFTPAALESSLGLSSDTNEVAGALSSSEISEADIDARKYDGATVEQWLVNWQNPVEKALLCRHQIGEITRQDDAFRVELRSFSATLDQPGGRYFTKTCDADLGDSRCGISLHDPAFRSTGIVSSNPAPTVQSFITTDLGEFEPNWFSGGTLVWLSGELTGNKSIIADVSRLEANGEYRVCVVHDFGRLPAPGDNFELFAGCDKSFETCKSRFSNHTNFRGFPHMPGNEKALNYLDTETPLDGGPIVP